MLLHSVALGCHTWADSGFGRPKDLTKGRELFKLWRTTEQKKTFEARGPSHNTSKRSLTCGWDSWNFTSVNRHGVTNQCEPGLVNTFLPLPHHCRIKCAAGAAHASLWPNRNQAHNTSAAFSLMRRTKSLRPRRRLLTSPRPPLSWRRFAAVLKVQILLLPWFCSSLLLHSTRLWRCTELSKCRGAAALLIGRTESPLLLSLPGSARAQLELFALCATSDFAFQSISITHL